MPTQDARTADAPSIELIPLGDIPMRRAATGRTAAYVRRMAVRLAEAVRLDQGLMIRLRPEDRPSMVRNALTTAAAQAKCGVSVQVGEYRPYAGKSAKQRGKTEPAMFYVRPRPATPRPGSVTAPPPGPPRTPRSIAELLAPEPPRRAQIRPEDSRVTIPLSRAVQVGGAVIDR